MAEKQVTVTISFKKRFKVQTNLMIRVIQFVWLFSETKAERMFDWYIEHIENNVGKYIIVK